MRRKRRTTQNTRKRLTKTGELVSVIFANEIEISSLALRRAEHRGSGSGVGKLLAEDVG